MYIINKKIILKFLLVFVFMFLVIVQIQAISVANSKDVIVTNNLLPIILKIPKLNISTSVESVGLTTSGAMDVPQRFLNVGWFNLGTKIGEKGTAVLDGHSGYKNNVGAIFDNLYKLKKGDIISVFDEKGNTTNFVVQKLKSYNPNQKVSEVFTSSDNLSHLNLITCNGTWDPILKSHSKRLVVFTDKVI